MATNDDQAILECSACQRPLDLESKTLSCLHSFCRSCFDKEFQGETSENGQCPECHEIVKIDELTLSPVLASSLKCRQMESTNWKCELCLEEVNESVATHWCSNCRKIFCTKCSRFHNKLHQKHRTIEFDGIGKDEVLKAMRIDVCNIHNKVEESYCNRCNVCICETCYIAHLHHSPHCSSHPVLLWEEALKKQRTQAPTLLKEIDDLENNLREINNKSWIYSEELERDCELRCKEIWHNYEELLEELRDKTHKMCNELRTLKDTQVKKWQELVEKNEKILKKLEIWRINLCHLLKDNQKEKDIVCGIELVRTKLASASPQVYTKITEPVRKCELGMKFSDYWLQFLEGLKNEMIGSAFLNFPRNLVRFENEWILQGSNSCTIESILLSQDDNHVFLADSSNCSIIELTESGELISICRLIHKGNKFYPLEMIFSSPNVLIVICFLWYGEKKILFLERQKTFPFLQIRKIVDIKKRASDSICLLKETILICDGNFQIHFYTKMGKYIKTIDTGESKGGNYRPRIRADPSTWNFWGVRPNTCTMFCFDENGQKLQTFETVEKIFDFSINEFGNIYLCNFEGFSSFFPEKVLYRFQKKSESLPKIFASREKILVYVRIDKKNLIQIFKFLD